MKIVILALTGCLAAGAAAAATQYVYPAKGQGKDQQARDEAACSEWAVQQSGFDPAKKAQAQASTGTSVDSVAKILSSPAAGAAIGAVAGKGGGGASDIASLLTGVGGGGSGLGAVAALAGGGSTTSTATGLLNQTLGAQPTQQATLAPGEADFYRARAACLTGRGYSVQ